MMEPSILKPSESRCVLPTLITSCALRVQVRIGGRINVEHSGVIALKGIVDAIGRNPLLSRSLRPIEAI